MHRQQTSSYTFYNATGKLQKSVTLGKKGAKSQVSNIDYERIK